MTGSHIDQTALVARLDKRAVWWGRGTVVSLAGLVLLGVIMLTQWAGNHSQDRKINSLESHGRTQDGQISVLQSVANANAAEARKAGGTPVPVPQFTASAPVVAVPGPAGPTGVKGDPGAPGTRGPQGLKGATGPSGASMTGPAGENGGQGAPGPAGAAGKDGTNGADGATGPQGPQGDTGPAGPDECTTAGGTWTTQPPAIPGGQAQLVCTLPSQGGN